MPVFAAVEIACSLIFPLLSIGSCISAFPSIFLSLAVRTICAMMSAVVLRFNPCISCARIFVNCLDPLTLIFHHLISSLDLSTFNLHPLYFLAHDAAEIPFFCTLRCFFIETQLCTLIHYIF